MNFRKKNCEHDWTDWTRKNVNKEEPKVRMCLKCHEIEYQSHKVDMLSLMNYCKEQLPELSKRNLQEVQKGKLGVIEFIQCNAYYERCKWGIDSGERFLELTEEEYHDVECFNITGKSLKSFIGREY